MESLYVNIPTSFVKNELKYKKQTGRGEAKLFIGKKTIMDKLNKVFNNFSEEKNCVIFKKNLLDYLKRTEIEYIGHKYGDYRKVDLDYYKRKLEEVSNLEEELSFDIVQKIDKADRVYIRASSDKDSERAFDLIRGIALPIITKLVITNKGKNIEFTLDLNYDVLCKKYGNCKNISAPHQRIFFGAPGTGKSFRLNQEAKKNFKENYERVTFHPNYMYGNFVGAFKPFPKPTGEKYKGGKEKQVILYKYVPGPLMEILVKALENPDNPYLLIIEEINRANTAAVFGDLFQLLDRDSSGESEYPIAVSEELRGHLTEKFKKCKKKQYVEEKIGKDYNRLILPSNFYIWCTMNSADQGVMPMDTAFKRRWDFTYIGIDEAIDDLKEFEKYKFTITVNDNNSNDGKKEVKEITWNEFRTKVNKRLLDYGVSEDKLLGPYFLSKTILEKSINDKPIDKGKYDEINAAIENKVLMYLYEDAGKPFRFKIFEKKKSKTYSELCKNFREIGDGVFTEPLNLEFCENISENENNDNIEEDSQNSSEV